MKRCKSCGNSKEVYGRLWYRFDQVRGRRYCVVREEMITPEGTCESWEKKRQGKYDLSAERFDKAEEDIKKMIERFKEEKGSVL